MSETTSKLSLFKYNTTADAKQPFSIKDCMNDNWDKLDAFATSVDTIFSSSFSSNLDKKVFSDINKELGKKLEADVLLAENGYIKFNNKVLFVYGHILGANNGFATAYFATSFSNTSYKCIITAGFTAYHPDREGCWNNKQVSSVDLYRDDYCGQGIDYLCIGY